MRIIYMIVLMLIGYSGVFAQRSETQGPQNERKELDGFVIQIRPAANGTFLFDILKEGRPVYQQTNNPFTMQPEGFEKRQDAFNIAGWLIREFKAQQHFPLIIPPHIADQYKIRIIRDTNKKQN